MQALILAAGKGSRMHSAKAKCMETILDVPILQYQIQMLKKNGIEDILLVVGDKKENILGVFSYPYVIQQRLTGTAEAVRTALPFLKEKDDILILPADTLLLEEDILNDFIQMHHQKNYDFSVLAMEKENPFGYGRVLIDQQRVRIIEQSELKEECFLCNSGIYLTDKKILETYLPNIKPRLRECYFTDLCGMIEGSVGVYISPSPIFGINTYEQLEEAQHAFQEKINRLLQRQGVYLEDSKSIFISPDSVIESGNRIDSGCKILHSKIGKNNHLIGRNRISNSCIGENNQIEDSVIEDATIGSENRIGPFAHFRSQSEIGNENRIGNFVELKAAVIQNQTNAAHLAYLGNVFCGSKVNFGCGSITVNYDGKLKHQTYIEDQAFIGCNSNLIAPLTIRKNSMIAAGSTITSDVDEDSLAIARARQITKEGYRKKNEA